MMFAELYRVGCEMKSRPDWPIDMYVERKIRFEVQLASNGTLRSVVSIDPDERSLGRINAPDRPNNKEPSLLVDKPEYVLGAGEDGPKMHEKYMDRLRKCAVETGDADIQTIAAYLTANHFELTAELEGKGLGEKTGKGKSSLALQWINFSVDGRYPIESQHIKDWWSREARDELPAEETCFITGNKARIIRKYPVSVTLNGTDCVLASVDSPACKSYGYDKSDHAPMSFDAAVTAGNALKLMLSDPLSSKRLGNVTFAFWTRQDSLRSALVSFVFGDESNRADLKTFLDSPFKGHQVQPASEKFYMFTATNTKSRVVIKSSLDTSLKEAVENVGRWFEGMELVGQDGRVGDTYESLFGIHRSLTNGSSRSDSVLLMLIERAYFAIPIPRSVCSYVVSQAVSAIHNKGTDPRFRSPRKEHISILKVYLSQLNQEVSKLVSLREDFRDLAYLYGRLMAAYESIQLKASPNVQSTVTERFFSSMMANPKRTISRLDQLSRSHLRIVAREHGQGLAFYFRARLGQINDQIDPEEAAPIGSLSLEQRGMFVLGYWHEKFNRKSNDKEDTDVSADQ